MRALLKSSIGVWWMVLVAATVLSWWIGTDHGVSDPRLAAALLVAVSLLKVGVIGSHFMELRSADLRLQRAFQGYTVIVAVGLIGMLYAL